MEAAQPDVFLQPLARMILYVVGYRQVAGIAGVYRVHQPEGGGIFARGVGGAPGGGVSVDESPFDPELLPRVDMPRKAVVGLFHARDGLVVAKPELPQSYGKPLFPGYKPVVQSLAYVTDGLAYLSVRGRRIAYGQYSAACAQMSGKHGLI